MILKQFDGAAVAPRDDAILYNAIIKKNGVFKGVEITHIGSNQLHITAGHGILKGRVWEQEEETIHCNLATSGTLKGRAYIHMDLTDMDTPIKIMTVAAASLPELIQDEDCNYTNGIYEMELCTYDVTDLAISNLEVTYNNISEILPIIGKMEDLAALTEKGYVADALLVAELIKNMGNCTLSVQSDGAYITYTPTGGADPVTKKLGNANFSFSVQVKGVAKSKANSSERYSVSGTATGSCTDGIVDFSQQFFQSGGYEWNSSADGKESIGVYVQGVTITFDD